MSIEKQIEKLIELLPELLKNAKDKAPYVFQALIGAEMLKGSFTKGEPWLFEPNTGTILRNYRGSYYQSFLEKNPNSKTKINLTEKGLDGVIGSGLDFMIVHETGKFIRAKNFKMSKRGVPISKMAAYFWAMYFQSQKQYWKFVALSVMRKGGVNIPKRPTFAPALKKFELQWSLDLDKLFNAIIKKANE
jgi:hypothetical protein